MPSDEQIWVEVQERLAVFPESLRKSRNFTTPDQLFSQRKQWYLDTPKRLAAVAKEKQELSKRQAAADKKFLAERKQQGLPTYTQAELAIKYPADAKLQSETLTQQQLHEYADVLEQLQATSDLHRDYMQYQSLSRKSLFEYLARAYGIYQAITHSYTRQNTMAEVRGLLIANGRRSVVRANASDVHCFLALVFSDADSKTIHLYSNAFALAMGYEIDSADFASFIKDIGGLEKIRSAYAKVRAADAGKLIPAYVKKAEEYASLQALGSARRIVIQLGKGEGSQFRHDLLDQYCLLLAHVDPLDQIEIVGQLPSTKSIEAYALDRISTLAKKKGTGDWHADKKRAERQHLSSFLEAHDKKERMAAEAIEKKKKKQAASLKKAAALERRHKKQRQKSQAATKASSKA